MDESKIKPTEISIDEKYKNIIRDVFTDKIINDESAIPITDSVFFKFDNIADREKAFYNLFGDENSLDFNIIKNHDLAIINIHGTETGEVAYQGAKYSASTFIQALENTGMIPEGTKKIYTMSCYGGLQKPGVTKNGIPFESIHTSDVPIVAAARTHDFNLFKGTFFEESRKIGLENFVKQVNETKKQIANANEEDSFFINQLKEEFKSLNIPVPETKEDLIKELDKQVDVAKKQLDIFVNENSPHIIENYDVYPTSVVSGKISESYKKDAIRLYEKYGEHYSDISLTTGQGELAYIKTKFSLLFKDQNIRNDTFQQEIEGNIDSIKRGINDSKKLNDIISKKVDYSFVEEQIKRNKEWTEQDKQRYKEQINRYNKYLDEAKAKGNETEIKAIENEIRETKKIYDDRIKILQEDNERIAKRFTEEKFSSVKRIKESKKDTEKFIQSKIKEIKEIRSYKNIDQEVFDNVFEEIKGVYYDLNNILKKETGLSLEQIDSLGIGQEDIDKFMDQDEFEKLAERLSKLENFYKNFPAEETMSLPNDNKLPLTTLQKSVKKPNTEKSLNNKTSSETSKLSKQQVNKSNNLQNKTTQSIAKNSLNTKKLGLVIAGTIALAGTAGIIVHNNKKEKDEKKDNKEKKQHKTGLYESFDYNNYDHYYEGKDTNNARQISSFSKGHSTLKFR